MDTFVRQDIQKTLVSRLAREWVLTKTDLEVIDASHQAHMLDIALHTGEFMYGRITIGRSNRRNLAGVEDIHCDRVEDIERCIYMALALQHKYCPLQQMDSQMLSAVA